MEEVVSYVAENQILFYVIGVSIVLAIILMLILQVTSKKEEEIKEEDTEVKPKEVPVQTVNQADDYIDFSKKKEELEEKLQVEPEPIKVNPIVTYEKEQEPTTEIELIKEQLKYQEEEKKIDPIKSYEDYEEEHAIISYQELLKANKNSDEISMEEENVPIVTSIKELEALTKEKKEPLFVEEEKEEPILSTIIKEMPEETKEETKEEIKDNKFKNTDFISPIYGKINDTALEYPKIKSFKEEKVEEEPKEESSTFIEIDELNEEAKRNEEFLQALKEFRKNL